MKRWIALLFAFLCQHALAQVTIPPCTTSPTAGFLTINCVETRNGTGISPLTVFFDCSGSVDPAVLNTVTQDVYFEWNFGDTGTSGTGFWLYGSNPGGNSTNTASGEVAAHLYVLPIGSTTDVTYTVTVKAYDGSSIVSCTMPVTVYAPSGTHGFPGNLTTCYFNSAVGSGCPTGATQTVSSTEHAPTANHAILYKCGDTFTGNTPTAAINQFMIGAYGACSNVPITAANQANYPQMSGTIALDTTATDGRVSDLVCNTGANGCETQNNAWFPPFVLNNRITVNNMWSNATVFSFDSVSASEQGYFHIVFTHMGGVQAFWVNQAENRCSNGQLYPCTGFLVNVNYNAVIGSHMEGTGATGGGGVETVRIPACRMCVFTNSDYWNANTVGAVFKLHDGNSNSANNTFCQWLGNWTEHIEISDNYFFGTSGAELVENVSQNGGTDERLRNIVFERNVVAPSQNAHQMMVGAINETIRNNAFHNSGLQIANRGNSTTGPGSSNNSTGSSCSGTGTTTAPVIANYPTGVEVYNNVFYTGGQVGFFTNLSMPNPATASFAENNLTYQGSGISAGSGNTVSNNSPNTTTNPGFANGSGAFSQILDFKPTIAGAVTGADPSVPNFFDCAGYAWVGGQQLGACSAVAH